jgi:hypothetical protein
LTAMLMQEEEASRRSRKSLWSMAERSGASYPSSMCLAQLTAGCLRMN